MQQQPTFQELLAALKNNISRSNMEPTAGITQIRQMLLNMGLTITVTGVRPGPNYYSYPKAWQITDLQGLWMLSQFTSVTGSSNVIDEMGNNHGTINGNPTFSSELDTVSAFEIPTIGRKRWFMKCDGTGDFVNLGDITALDGATQMSWAGVFRLNNLTNPQVLISRWPSADGDKQFRIVVRTNGQLRYREAIDGVGGIATRTATTTTIVANTWYRFIVTKTGNTITISINGLNQAINTIGTPGTLETVASDVLIGRDEDDTANDLDGDVGEIAWWNDDLSAAEVDDYETDSYLETGVVGECKCTS